jgi:hypothetical protein
MEVSLSPIDYLKGLSYRTGLELTSIEKKI